VNIDFRDTLAARQHATLPRVSSIPAPTIATPNNSVESSPAFADVLASTQQSDDLKLSSHALTRMKQRGMELSPTDMNTIGQAVTRAQEKGAKEAYVMYGDHGYVVSVPNRTIITAMMNQTETIVTHVDSVVVIPRLDR